MLADWDAVRRAAMSTDGLASYERAVAEQHRLRDLAFAAGGRERTLERLSTIVDASLSATIDGARDALARSGRVDDAFARVAAGAASEAAYRAALALAVGEREHPFVATYALFLAGRWPLGGLGDGYALF